MLRSLFKKPSAAAVAIGLITTSVICLTVVVLKNLFPAVPEQRRVKIATYIGLFTVIGLMIVQGIFHIF